MYPPLTFFKQHQNWQLIYLNIYYILYLFLKYYSSWLSFNKYNNNNNKTISYKDNLPNVKNKQNGTKNKPYNMPLLAYIHFI